MRSERISKSAIIFPSEPGISDLEASEFVPVAIPSRLDDARQLKANLEAYEIPTMLESEIDPNCGGLTGGMPVLVPECRLEQASQIVGFMELNALDDDEDDEFEDLDDFDDEDELDDFDELDDEDEFEDEDEFDDEDYEPDEDEDEDDDFLNDYDDDED